MSSLSSSEEAFALGVTVVVDSRSSGPPSQFQIQIAKAEPQTMPTLRRSATRSRSGSAESDGSVELRAPALKRTGSFSSDVIRWAGRWRNCELVELGGADGRGDSLGSMGSDVSSEDLDGMSLDDLELLRDNIRHGRAGSDGRECIRVTLRFRYG